MTNQTNEVVEAVEAVEVKAKRVRKPVVKETKTGAEIVAYLTALETEVEELSSALEEIAPNSVFFPIAQEKVTEKQTELENALQTVYSK